LVFPPYQQSALFEEPKVAQFPSTRFQGSKAKLVDRIWECIKDLNFQTALYLFGGTGAVGYMLKTKGKQVYYNDYLTSNYLLGLALAELQNLLGKYKRNVSEAFRSGYKYALSKNGASKEILLIGK